MPAGAIIIPDKAVLNIVGPVNLLNSAKTFNLSLHTSAWAPDPAVIEVFADVGNEIAAGNGYTAGGLALPNDALTLTGDNVKFSADGVEWTAAVGSIPAWRYGVIRAVGTFSGKVDPIVGYFLGEIGQDPANPVPADVPATTAGNKLAFAPNAAGIATIAKA